MKTAALTLIALAALTLTALTQPALAEAAPNTLTDAEKKAGWKLLFDGKTLAGWNSWKTKKALKVGAWQAKDGALALTGRGGGDIYTAKPYEHYEFSVEWKTTGNSGILFRVDPSSKGPIYGVAPEVQVLRDNPKALKSTSAGGLYALYDIDLPEKKINPDGWNEMRIRLVNGKGTHWFNGDKVAEYEIGSDDWRARVGKSKFGKVVDKFGMTKNGHIGFQDHGAKVVFRNIKIREINPGN